MNGILQSQWLKWEFLGLLFHSLIDLTLVSNLQETTKMQLGI